MELQVHARGWQNTGFKPGAQSGKYVVVRAAGVWQLMRDGQDPKFGLRDADGRQPNVGNSYMSPTNAGNYTYAGYNGYYGQLIGKIGEKGAPFIVGTYGHIDIDSSDRNSTLWLCVNDEPFALGNNTGALEVKIYTSDGGRDVTPRWEWGGVPRHWYMTSG